MKNTQITAYRQETLSKDKDITFYTDGSYLVSTLKENTTPI